MLLFDKREPVTEKYRGSNHPELKVIERELEKIIKVIDDSTKPLTDESWNIPDINTASLTDSNSNKIIENQFTKLFNLKGCSLTWDFAPGPNAFTPCATFQLFSDDKGKTHNAKEKVFVGIHVSTGLVTYSKMNEKEILAIILHEIGHNFYNSPFQVLSRLSLSIPSIVKNPELIPPKLMGSFIGIAIADVITVPLYKKYLASFQKMIDKVFPLYTKFMYIVNDFMYNLTSISQRQLNMEVIDLPKLLEKGSLFSFNNLFLYNVEKHADSFAVDYGYGIYLAAALEKLGEKEGTVGSKLYNIKGLNWTLDLFNIQFEIFSLFISGYPSEQNRIRTGLDRLKRASKDKNLSPSLRKELESQIKDYEDFYNNHYLSIQNDKNKRKIFTWMYHCAIEKVFKGKMDARELLHAVDHYKYK